MHRTEGKRNDPEHSLPWLNARSLKLIVLACDRSKSNSLPSHGVSIATAATMLRRTAEVCKRSVPAEEEGTRPVGAVQPPSKDPCCPLSNCLRNNPQILEGKRRTIAPHYHGEVRTERKPSPSSYISLEKTSDKNISN